MEKVPTVVVFFILDTDYETGASDLWKITVNKEYPLFILVTLFILYFLVLVKFHRYIKFIFLILNIIIDYQIKVK